MKKVRFFILVNVCFICIWLVARQTNLITKNYNINLTVEDGVSQEMIDEVQEAMQVMPVSIMDEFVKDDWKIVLLMTFDDTEGYENIGDDTSVVGLINYPKKTITIKGVPEYQGTVKNIMVHELAHFADRLLGTLSNSRDLLELYKQYKDGKYINYSYAGVTITDKYSPDILYATSSAKEFFAESLKDYYMHPDYLKKNYEDIYGYFKGLKIEEVTEDE